MTPTVSGFSARARSIPAAPRAARDWSVSRRFSGRRFMASVLLWVQRARQNGADDVHPILYSRRNAMTVPVRQVGICQGRRAAPTPPPPSPGPGPRAATAKGGPPPPPGAPPPVGRRARAAFAALPHAGVLASRWPYQDAGAGQRRTSRWKISRLSFLVCMKSGALSVSSVGGGGGA